MSKLLTIAIPTYNRKKELTIQLERLKNVFKNLSANELSEVDVFVSDNGSTYDVASLLERFQKEFPGTTFRYAINEKNLGFDTNIAKLYNKANGMYVWFLSDDDNFRCDTVSVLLGIIRNNDPISLIVLNSYDEPRKDGDMVDLIPYSPSGYLLRLSVGTRKRVESDYERFNALSLSGQISHCVVLKKDLELNTDFSGGGMQGQIANFAMLELPYYYITKEGLITPGPKTDLSYWFVEALLFGTKQNLSYERMKFPRELVDTVCIQTAKVILGDLVNRHFICRNIDYPELDSIKDRLQATYGERYGELDDYIHKVRIDRSYAAWLLLKIKCIVFGMLRTIKSVLIPKNNNCLGGL